MLIRSIIIWFINTCQMCSIGIYKQYWAIALILETEKQQFLWMLWKYMQVMFNNFHMVWPPFAPSNQVSYRCHLILECNITYDQNHRQSWVILAYEHLSVCISMGAIERIVGNLPICRVESAYSWAQSTKQQQQRKWQGQYSKFQVNSTPRCLVAMCTFPTGMQARLAHSFH